MKERSKVGSRVAHFIRRGRWDREPGAARLGKWLAHGATARTDSSLARRTNPKKAPATSARRDAGVTQFNVYLMNGDEEEQLDLYRALTQA